MATKIPSHNAALLALQRVQTLSLHSINRGSALQQQQQFDTSPDAVAAAATVAPLVKAPLVRAALNSVGSLTFGSESRSADAARGSEPQTQNSRRLGASGRRMRSEAGKGVLSGSQSLIGYSDSSGVEPALSSSSARRTGSVAGTEQYALPAASDTLSAGAPQSAPSSASAHTAASHAVPALARADAAAAAITSGDSSSFQPKKRLRAAEQPTAGRLWFDMPAVKMTEEIKRDLLVLRNRSYLNPKHHYKTAGEEGAKRKTLPRFFAIGTVQETPAEALFASTRAPRAFKNASLSEQLLRGDGGAIAAHAAKNYAAASAAAAAGGRKSLSGKRFAAAPKWKRQGGVGCGSGKGSKR